ncbi:MAG TPA: thiamine pyrophosphate-dependent enzyme [Methanomicrobiales archaeon]|nr:thiamine pyrophosphate-dependent enzyme [Methanomicrobiales archaeon]
MKGIDLVSRAKNTWCPGCGNFAVQHALKDLLAEMDGSGELPLEKVVLVAGIGQHGKLFDFLNVNGFYSLHGRTIPVATGIRLANPDLRVICVTGDGDSYAEGLDHLVFAAKRNLDITVLVHNNRVYGLTTGQYTPTSPAGYRGHSTPKGEREMPLNPVELMLASGATFIARGYTARREELKRLVHESVMHRGFSFIDVLQVCATYNNLTGYYNERVYSWPGEDVGDREAAHRKAVEWDYSADAKIGLGVMYQKDAPTFEDAWPAPPPLTDAQRAAWVAGVMDERS